MIVDNGSKILKRVMRMAMSMLLIMTRMMRTIMMILRTMVAIRMTNGGWATL